MYKTAIRPIRTCGRNKTRNIKNKPNYGNRNKDNSKNSWKNITRQGKKRRYQTNMPYRKYQRLTAKQKNLVDYTYDREANSED